MIVLSDISLVSTFLGINIIVIIIIIVIVNIIVLYSDRDVLLVLYSTDRSPEYLLYNSGISLTTYYNFIDLLITDISNIW